MKTLAIRLEDDQHARLSILSKLAGESLTDTIRAALDAHIERLAADTDVSSRAQSALEAIERDANEQRAAIASLFPGSNDTKTSAASGRSASRPKNG